METACSDERGFTLIEFLVAVLILMVGLLGLLQAVNLSLEQGMKNHFRNEAVTLTDEELSREMAKGNSQSGFAAISTGSRSYRVTRKVLAVFKDYSVTKNGTSVTQNTKEVDIRVSWEYRGVRQVHQASSLVSLRQQ